MKHREITEADRNEFVIVDSEDKSMFLKEKKNGDMETNEGLEGAVFFTSDEVKEFLVDNPTGWHIMTFAEALEQEKDQYEIVESE